MIYICTEDGISWVNSLRKIRNNIKIDEVLHEIFT